MLVALVLPRCEDGALHSGQPGHYRHSARHGGSSADKLCPGAAARPAGHRSVNSGLGGVWVCTQREREMISFVNFSSLEIIPWGAPALSMPVFRLKSTQISYFTQRWLMIADIPQVLLDPNGLSLREVFMQLCIVAEMINIILLQGNIVL